MTLSALLAATYVVALLGKTRDRGQFERYLSNLAGNRARSLAMLTLIVEAALAVGLAVAVAETGLRRPAGIASVGFLLVATGLHCAILARTRQVTCNCFGRATGAAERIETAWVPALVGLRNAVLVAASAVLAGASTQVIATVVGVIVLALALGLVTSIRAEHRVLKMDPHPSLADYGPTLRILQAHSWWLNGRPRPF